MRNLVMLIFLISMVKCTSSVDLPEKRESYKRNERGVK